jgi:hypothetical protein
MGLVVGPGELGMTPCQQPQHTDAWSSTRTARVRVLEAPRSPRTGRRWGRSCLTVPSPTAAPVTRGWPGCRPRSRQPRGAAALAGNRGRPRTRSPTLDHRHRDAWPTPGERGAAPYREGRRLPAAGEDRRTTAPRVPGATRRRHLVHGRESADPPAGSRGSNPSAESRGE